MVEEALDGKFNGHPPTIEYLARDDGTVSLVHIIQVQNEEINSWYEAYVDAHTGELISLTDFVAEASVSLITFWGSKPWSNLFYLSVYGGAYYQKIHPRRRSDLDRPCRPSSLSPRLARYVVE